jgi:Lon-like ATP-dependent protease
MLTSSLDVPIDLSRVLFVCTANVLHTIPRPLLDRLEIIELSGYVAAEKKAIAERFLGPQAKEQSGLKDVDVDISPEAVDTIIRWYARESGVRNLKKLIEKVRTRSLCREDGLTAGLPQSRVQDRSRSGRGENPGAGTRLCDR